MKFKFLIFAAFMATLGFANSEVVGHMTDETLRQFILTKPLVVVREKDSVAVRLEFKEDGRVYQNTYRAVGNTISSSGTWKFNDKNVKICMEFSDINTSGFCFGVMRDGNQVRLFTGPQKSPILWGTVKVDE
jgi:hypothetical protein